MTARDRWLLVRGDARRIPLPDGCVQCVVTSPPYYGLRDYGTGAWDGGDPECDHRESKPSRVAAAVAASGLEGGKGNVHRSHEYGDVCGRCGARRVDRQIGLEGSPEAYVAALVRAFREVRRVLRDDGTVWLNLGDSYSGGGGFSPDAPSNQPEVAAARRALHNQAGRRNDGGSRLYKGRQPAPGLKPKDLCGIPWACAFALRADGWFLRSAPPWIKVNAMPESVEDRPTTAHETVFLLAKRADYYWDADAVRVASAASTLERDKYSRIVQSGNKSHVPNSPDHSGLHAPYSVRHDHETPSHPAGRNRRTSDFFLESLDERIAQQRAYLAHLERVRRSGGMLLDEGGDPLALLVNPQPFPGAHFATFPPRLVEPCLRAGTSQRGCCPACGGPWVRVTADSPAYAELKAERGRWGHDQGDDLLAYGRRQRGTKGAANGPDLARLGPTKQTLGWQPSCSCPPHEPVPCLAFDPFSGSGTTGVVALALGLRYVGLDLSAEYLALSARRIGRPHAAIAAPAAQDEELPLFRTGGDA